MLCSATVSPTFPTPQPPLGFCYYCAFDASFALLAKVLFFLFFDVFGPLRFEALSGTFASGFR